MLVLSRRKTRGLMLMLKPMVVCIKLRLFSTMMLLKVVISQVGSYLDTKTPTFVLLGSTMANFLLNVILAENIGMGLLWV